MPSMVIARYSARDFARELLELRRAHAAARDAVHEVLNVASLRTECLQRGRDAVTFTAQRGLGSWCRMDYRR